MKAFNHKVHFVGVGGIGMSGLAEILLNLGYEVSGTDLAASPISDRLVERGLRFDEGHDASYLRDADIVVVSAAVPEDNPELASARKRGTPVIHRSELLADLMRLKPHAVAVGGTHGKTTTTSMISAVLDHANVGATSIVGGILQRSGTNARWGTGDYLVAEADEHDGSFLRLHPTISVVTNIDSEHLEYYGTLDKIKSAFIDFCNGVPFYGRAILCADDPNARSILYAIHSFCLTYGMGDDASLTASNVRVEGGDPATPLSKRLSNLSTCFEVTSHDERLHRTGKLGTLRVRALGNHNVQNAMAACAVGLSLGLPFPQVAEGLSQYDGVQRRLQSHGEHRGVLVIEDYAHHPTEVASTLEAIRWIEPKRIVVVFQPHLYSRTQYFSDQFAEVLSETDRTIVTRIYPSREEPMPGVTSDLIVDAARADGSRHVELINDMHSVPKLLAPDLQKGDVVLLLGAGDINKIAPALIRELGDSA